MPNELEIAWMLRNGGMGLRLIYFLHFHPAFFSPVGIKAAYIILTPSILAS